MITYKYQTIIFHDVRIWEMIRNKIKLDFGENIFLLSWRTKQELGFTVRYHKGLVPSECQYQAGRYHYQQQIHLDFFTESAMSWFCLKYIDNEVIDN